MKFSFSVAHRGIFVYNIFLVGKKSESVSNQATSHWILKERSTIYHPAEFEAYVLITFCMTKVKATLRNFAVFESQFLLDYYTQIAKHLTYNYVSFELWK